MMKIRILCLLFALVLLGGTMCGCDYTVDTDDTSVTTSATIDGIDETTSTIPVTTTTTRKFTTKATTTTTTKRIITTTKKVTEKPAEAMVWIPASGSKYHSKSSCSNMKNPTQVTKSYAIELGYTACKRCY